MIEDTYCKDTMNSLVYEDRRTITKKPIRANEVGEKCVLLDTEKPLGEIAMTTDDEILLKAKKFDHVLTFDDRELLVKYAPRLFNTSTNYQGIRDDMYELVNLVWEYRLHSSPNYGINQIRADFPSIYENDQAEIENAFIKHLDKLINNFMGGDLISNAGDIKIDHDGIKEGDLPNPKEVKKILQTMKENPSYYITTKPTKPKADKNEIKDYLAGLKLKNKTDEIKSFITALK